MILFLASEVKRRLSRGRQKKQESRLSRFVSGLVSVVFLLVMWWFLTKGGGA